ncbi:hypothetical protein [Cohaesibacter sp. ES.047]|uniref:hypothetical protein n=1 Tax=Cohaesibacter sp. ES.047 TaxID=1798205 RepID=UPI0018D53B57|nr:hypothetical protein [Cohaesibacter sp. ES.047]
MAADFVSAAEEMIEADLRVNGEFYVAPAYNLLIAKSEKIGVYNIGSEADGMYGLGIPADLNLFLELLFQRKLQYKNEDYFPPRLLERASGKEQGCGL